MFSCEEELESGNGVDGVSSFSGTGGGGGEGDGDGDGSSNGTAAAGGGGGGGAFFDFLEIEFDSVNVDDLSTFVCNFLGIGGSSPTNGPP
jgi:hypothetical protein